MTVQKRQRPNNREMGQAQDAHAHYATVLQTVVAIITLAIAMLSAGGSYVIANNTRIAIAELRISAVEKKDEQYDQLIAQRSRQWEELSGRLASIETTLKALAERERTKP